MSADENAGIPFRVRSLERRMEKLEDLEPAVVAKEVENLASRVDVMASAFNRLMGGIVLAAVTFAISVFALLGHH